MRVSGESAHDGLQGSSAGRYKQGMSELGDNILPFLSVSFFWHPFFTVVVAVLYLLTLQLKKKRKKKKEGCKRGSRRPAVKIKSPQERSLYVTTTVKHFEGAEKKKFTRGKLHINVTKQAK